MKKRGSYHCSLGVRLSLHWVFSLESVTIGGLRSSNSSYGKMLS